MRVKDNLILDDEGRTLILRGVNLGGDSKVPFAAPGSEIHPDFLDRKKEVSFIGRPFPIEEAEGHFRRLKNAGMTFLRFLVTWEAVEHEGPGIYDEAYLAYLRKILQAAEKEGISVFIDPHQDVWSRWTGGDGAPSWTMERLGMDLALLDRCGAAITKQRSKPYPQMIWPSNYNRYAAATMFTLFFAGKTYAADLHIDGENVQDWLQGRYIAAFKHVQRRLKNCPNITGWGSMNEPHFGFIGQKDLNTAEDVMIPVGTRPSPWQTILAASGHKVEVPAYGMMSMGRRISHYETFNPEKISLFKEGFSCPWKQAGVWSDANSDSPKLIKSDHFSQYQNRPAVFTDDFLKPFIVKYINAMKEANEQNFFFIEGTPNSVKAEAHPSWNNTDPDKVINAFHWYDGFTLFTKSFRSWFNLNPDTKKIILGKKNVSRYFKNCLAQGIKITKEKMGNMPCLLGEFGLPFDLNNRGVKKGDYSLHETALSMYYDAVDANLLHCTIWNYSASNSNKYGDSWNDEDLSIFSEGGERAAGGWKRPYPMATAGEPLSITWDGKRKKFVYRFDANGEITSPTIIYLPAEFFGASPKIEATACGGKNLRCEYQNEEQRLFVYNDGISGETLLKVSG